MNDDQEELKPVAGVLFWLASVAVIGMTAGALITNASGPVIASNVRLAQEIFAIEPLWFCTIGAFLVARRPRNLTAWALWAVGATIALQTLVQGVLAQYQIGHGVPLAVASWALWADNWSWVSTFVALVVLLLRFPDGALPSPRWRWIERLMFTAQAGAMVIAFFAGVSSDYPGIPSPIGVTAQPPAWIADSGGWVLFVTLIGGIVSTAIGLLIRYRRAAGAQRAQLQWLLAAAGLIAVLFVLSLTVEAAYGGQSHAPRALLDIGDVVIKGSLVTVPIAVAIAVTRHGLYEIGRIVSRTVSYTLVVALLAAAYVTVVTSLSALVPDRFGSLPVVVATLAASALFVPVRRRVIRVVDRRFNRGRYDADAVVAQFAERTRSRAGQGTTAQDLLSAARRALEPEHVSVWLVPQPVASRPGDAGE